MTSDFRSCLIFLGLSLAWIMTGCGVSILIIGTGWGAETIDQTTLDLGWTNQGWIISEYQNETVAAIEHDYPQFDNSTYHIWRLNGTEERKTLVEEVYWQPVTSGNWEMEREEHGQFEHARFIVEKNRGEEHLILRGDRVEKVGIAEQFFSGFGLYMCISILFALILIVTIEIVKVLLRTMKNDERRDRWTSTRKSH